MSSIFGVYADLASLIILLWLLVMATALIVSRYILPTFVSLPSKNFKNSLGFYVFSFAFLYACFPLVLKNQADSISLYKDITNNIWQLVTMVGMYHFAKSLGEKEKKEN
jgi:hypothetical protein